MQTEIGNTYIIKLLRSLLILLFRIPNLFRNFQVHVANRMYQIKSQKEYSCFLCFYFVVFTSHHITMQTWIKGASNEPAWALTYS